VDTQARVTKETTSFTPEMPSSVLLEVPALADFNKAWAELTDWLSRLDREIKAQRVTVGDLDDINDMIIKQKVWETLIFQVESLMIFIPYQIVSAGDTEEMIDYSTYGGYLSYFIS